MGGLAFEATERDLQQAFAGYGRLCEVKIIKDRETGRSRGFAFILYDRPESAAEALEMMDGAQIAGRAIRVNYAEDKSGPPARSAPTQRREEPVRQEPTREEVAPSVSGRRREAPPERGFVDQRPESRFTSDEDGGGGGGARWSEDDGGGRQPRRRPLR